MKNVYKQKRQEGFTIIEVMIVLAIAAVILLIVLLAVPALQRGSRNTQRNNDAAQISSAINTCLANHNSDVTQCEATGKNNVDIDFSKLGQLTSATYKAAPAASDTGSTTAAIWSFNEDCDSANNWAAGTSSRSFAIRFQLEASGGNTTQRCISS